MVFFIALAAQKCSQNGLARLKRHEFKSDLIRFFQRYILRVCIVTSANVGGGRPVH